MKTRQMFEEVLTGEYPGVELILSNTQDGDFISGMARLTASRGKASAEAVFPDESLSDNATLSRLARSLVDVLAIV